MTRLVAFEVKGLAGRSESVGFQFDDKINVFFGLNGSGKTSLLKILYSAVRNETDLLSRVAFDSASVTFYSQDHSCEIQRTITSEDVVAARPSKSVAMQGYVIDQDGRRIRLAESAPIWHSEPDISRPFQIRYLPITRMSTDYNLTQRQYARSEDPYTTESGIDEMFAEQLTQTWRRYSNELLSEVTRVQQEGLADILRSLFDTASKRGRDSTPLETEIAYKKATEFLARQGAKLPGNAKSFAAKYQDDERLRSVVDDIDRIEKRIEVAEQPRRQLQALVDEFIAPTKHIEFGIRDISVRVDADEIPLAALSSGEKQLLRIFVETLNAASNPIIVDEPELSMHIDWQRQLTAAMRTVNPDAQIIAATHSPEIMAFVPDANIHRL